jgi:hypothetical protein
MQRFTAIALTEVYEQVPSAVSCNKQYLQQTQHVTSSLTKARTRKKISRRNIIYYGIGRLEKPVNLQTVRKKIPIY